MSPLIPTCSDFASVELSDRPFEVLGALGPPPDVS